MPLPVKAPKNPKIHKKFLKFVGKADKLFKELKKEGKYDEFAEKYFKSLDKESNMSRSKKVKNKIPLN